jgi:hypothetical protein
LHFKLILKILHNFLEIDLSDTINKVIIIETPPQQPKFEGKLLPLDLQNLNKTTQALYLSISSNNIMDLTLRYNLISSVPKFLTNFPIKNLLLEKISQVEKKINLIDQENEKYFNDLTVNNLINKMFTPSKTAQNGLTFVNKAEEEILCKKEQPEEILNVFRIIYIILNINIDEIPNNKLIDNLINSVLPSIKVDSLSKFIFLYQNNF